MKRVLICAIAIVALHVALASRDAGAVSLNPDGLGEALLFPYYTVRSVNGNPYHTYVSIVNHNADAKALRVRFREGRNSKEVASFNLFLAPNDTWAAAVVPTTSGARLISVDRSCVSPPFAAEGPGLDLTNAGYLGDGNGDELDRVREGWIEVVEMATLTGASAAAITQLAFSGSFPNNCAAVQGSATLETAVPSGGVAGTLTIINVASGLDFTVNAVALADLASAPYYRAANDPYPGLDSSEIRPVSAVTANGFQYRSTWERGIDAVSAALMRSSWFGEVILDAGTASLTDFVVVFPTRHHYVTGSTATAPFTAACLSPPVITFAGEPISMQTFTREGAGGNNTGTEFIPVLTPNFRCGPATVVDFHSSSPHAAFTPQTAVLASSNRALPFAGDVRFGTNGWAGFRVTGGRVLTSLASSTRTSLATGETTAGAHQFSGLPAIGFSVRTFVNGTLPCAGGVCQGNYGGAFPLRFKRTISP